MARDWTRLRHKVALPAPSGKVRRAKPHAGRASPSEAQLEHRCVTWAHARGWLTRKMNGLGFNSWEDRLCLPPARYADVPVPPLWVELKRPGEEPTPLQRAHHREMRRRGQVTRVVHTFEEFKTTLAAHLHDYCD